jgi:Holliday junction resolvasome RuvABC endonuclease subunit
MSENNDDFSEHDMFVTDFPKKGFGIVDYLQGRVHFSLMDQMKLMHKSGMTQIQIKETILESVTEIIDNFEPESVLAFFGMFYHRQFG